ncbi:hypothetical protein CDAR_2781 [Caerostris darwini]|uniref:Uncharacterized protein n=1 Tax=Caerostris darwini TaxID=1538125 RepID=A0AAV4SS19_9ARAC|nr:hypothetical protein CDAR_2781 [Caerostris darwini]
MLRYVWRKAICIIKPSSTLQAFIRYQDMIFVPHFEMASTANIDSTTVIKNREYGDKTKKKPAVNCCNLLNNFVPVHLSQLDRHLQFRSVTSGVTIHHVTDHVRCRPSRQSLFTPRTSFIFFPHQMGPCEN